MRVCCAERNSEEFGYTKTGLTLSTGKNELDAYVDSARTLDLVRGSENGQKTLVRQLISGDELLNVGSRGRYGPYDPGGL